MARMNSQNDKYLKGSRQKKTSRGRCCGEIDSYLYVHIFFFNWTIKKNPLLLTSHSQIAQHLIEEAFALWKIDCHSHL